MWIGNGQSGVESGGWKESNDDADAPQLASGICLLKCGFYVTIYLYTKRSSGLHNLQLSQICTLSRLYILHPHTPSHTLTHPHTPSHTLTQPHTPSHNLTHPHTPSHTLIHPHPPSHTLKHPHTPSQMIPWVCVMWRWCVDC